MKYWRCVNPRRLAMAGLWSEMTSMMQSWPTHDKFLIKSGQDLTSEKMSIWRMKTSRYIFESDDNLHCSDLLWNDVTWCNYLTSCISRLVHGFNDATLTKIWRQKRCQSGIWWRQSTSSNPTITIAGRNCLEMTSFDVIIWRLVDNY